MGYYSRRQYRGYSGKNSSRGQCSISYEPTIDAYKLSFDYHGYDPQHKNFVDVLKSMIPSSDREYKPGWTHPETGVYTAPYWIIAAKATDGSGKDWYKILEIMIDATFDPVFKFSKEQYDAFNSYTTVTPKISASEYINRFNQITINLGIAPILDDTKYEDATKLYRKAVMKLHPDRNPNDPNAATNMSKLNEAWDVIKEQKYKQVNSVKMELNKNEQEAKQGATI